MGGNLTDKNALRAAIAAADFQSVRGPFRFGTNQYPVQDFWQLQVARRPDGKFQTETVRKVLEPMWTPGPPNAACRRASERSQEIASPFRGGPVWRFILT